MSYDIYRPITPYPAGIANIMAATASNVRGGDNPPYTYTDFLTFYPQFTGNINTAILTRFIAMSDAVVKETRWHEMWQLGMALFVAHFATLYLQAIGDGTTNQPASAVVAAAQSRGLISSEGAGDLSVSYDMGSLSSDLEGWAAWKLTGFGVQYATLAKTLGMAPMYVR